MRLLGFRFFLFFYAIEGLIIGSSLYGSILPGSGWLGSGFSFLNLLLLFGALLVVLASLVLLSARRISEDISTRIIGFLADDKGLIIVLTFSSLLLYESFQDILFLRADIEPIHYLRYREILGEHLGLLGATSLFSLQIIILSIIHCWNRISSWIKILLKNKIFYTIVVLALFFIFASTSGIGRIFASPHYPGFTVLSVPILGIQVIITLLGMLLFAAIQKILRLDIHWDWFKDKDWLVMIFIGLTAYLSWITIPQGASAFTDIPRPPNFEFYPTSDALHFDQGAQQILVGNGFKNYSHVGFQLYLAILHLLAGVGYQQILPLQLIVLSLIPVLLYRLTSQLHNKVAGILVSILFIIRAANGIYLGEHVTNPSVFDLMSEPYGVLGVVLASTLFLSWYLNPERHRLYPLIVGGLFATTALIRAESLVLLPVMLAFMIYRLHRTSKGWIGSSLAGVLGFVLVVGPALISQYGTTRSANVLLFGKDRNFEWALPYYQDNDANDQRADLSEIYPYHLLNNLFQYVIYLPSNHQPLLTIANLPDLFSGNSEQTDLEGDSFPEKYLERYTRSLPYWWKGEWSGSLASRSYLPVLGTISLIVIGFYKIPQNKRIMAVLLLVSLALHSFLYAFIGQSGGRFIQMMDWIPLMLYCIGLSWLLGIIIRFLNIGYQEFWWSNWPPLIENTQRCQPVINQGFLAISLILLVIGLSFPAADRWISQHYSLENLNSFTSQGEGMQIDSSGHILDDQGALTSMDVVYGKALYPRFFKAGDHMADIRSGSTPDFSQSRVEFYLVGSENIWISVPVKQENIELPHGSDVMVLGVFEDAKIDQKGEQLSGDYISAEYIDMIVYGIQR
jgi:hypothetical protein